MYIFPFSLIDAKMFQNFTENVRVLFMTLYLYNEDHCEDYVCKVKGA